jgi:ankyrin repeat protein
MAPLYAQLWCSSPLLQLSSAHTLTVQCAPAASLLNLQDGYTPLLLACQQGHTEVVRQLLDRGAKVDATNKARPRCWLAFALTAPWRHVLRAAHPWS